MRDLPPISRTSNPPSHPTKALLAHFQILYHHGIQKFTTNPQFLGSSVVGPAGARILFLSLLPSPAALDWDGMFG